VLHRLLDPLLPETAWHDTVAQRFPAYAAHVGRFVDPNQLDMFGTAPVVGPMAQSEIVEVEPAAGLLGPWPYV
jgi:hypothetical protein